MYACLCRAVPERSVRETVAAGASTVSQLREACGAGTGCGGCLPSLRRLLRECLGAGPTGTDSKWAESEWAESEWAESGCAELTCTAAAVLDVGMGLNLESTCSANCAEATGPSGEPMCKAGLQASEPVDRPVCAVPTDA